MRDTIVLALLIAPFLAGSCYYSHRVNQSMEAAIQAHKLGKR